MTQVNESTIEIRIALLRSRKTQVQIARRLGISKQYLHKVVKGQRRTPYVRKAIARAAGKSVRELWPQFNHKRKAA